LLNSIDLTQNRLQGSERDLDFCKLFNSERLLPVPAR